MREGFVLLLRSPVPRTVAAKWRTQRLGDAL